MKKLVFNEGGQPTFLDDLETLQANSMEQAAAFAKGLTGTIEGAFFLDTPHKNGSPYFYVGPDMYVLVNGKVIKTTGEELTSAGGNIYLHVYDEDVDERTLENGVTASCGKNTIAVFRNNNIVTVGQAYLVKDMKTVQEFLLVNCEEKVQVKENRCYDGTISMTKVKFANNTRYTLKFRGNNSTWTSETAHHPIYLPDEIWGMSSPIFKLGDALVTLAFKGDYLSIVPISGSIPSNPSECNFTVTFDVY